jgi:hypothetical protein
LKHFLFSVALVFFARLSTHCHEVGRESLQAGDERIPRFVSRHPPTLEQFGRFHVFLNGERYCPFRAKCSTLNVLSPNFNPRTDFHFGQAFKAISAIRSSSLRIAPVDGRISPLKQLAQ